MARRRYFRSRRLIRRPFIRRKRMHFRRRLGRRPRLAKHGNVQVKATIVQGVALSSTAQATVIISPTLANFTEAVPFAALYENYRLRKVVVRVVPAFNNVVATESIIAPYAIAPWHKEITTTSTITVDNLLTLDKHKFIRADRPCRMAFTPAVSITSINGSTAAGSKQYSWKPQLSTSASTFSHYCGLIAFPSYGSGTTTEPPSYAIHITGYFEFQNQKLNIV